MIRCREMCGTRGLNRPWAGEQLPPGGHQNPWMWRSKQDVAHCGIRSHIVGRKSFMIAGGNSHVARSGQQLIVTSSTACGTDVMKT